MPPPPEGGTARNIPFDTCHWIIHAVGSEHKQKPGDPIAAEALASIDSRIDAYDPTQSTTIVQRKTCVADLCQSEGYFFITCPTGSDITADDWDACVEAFPIRTAEFDWEFHIWGDFDVYVFHEIGEPLGNPA